jgi:hypothetical protein
MFKAVVALLIGAGFLIAAMVAGHATLNFLSTSIQVPGRVVRLNAGGSHPEIEFVTQTGDHISYPQGGMIFGMKVGDEVQVRYQSDAPVHSATVVRFGAIWDTVLYLTFVGCVFIVGGWLNLPARK